GHVRRLQHQEHQGERGAEQREHDGLVERVAGPNRSQRARRGQGGDDRLDRDHVRRTPSRSPARQSPVRRIRAALAVAWEITGLNIIRNTATTTATIPWWSRDSF